MKDLFTRALKSSLGELIVQTSSGVRMSNIFIAHSFEEVDGYIGLGLSMGQPIYL